MKLLFTPYIYILFFSLWNSVIFSQEISLEINTVIPENRFVLEKVNYKNSWNNSKNLSFTLDTISLQLKKMGYLNNKLETLIRKDSIFSATYDLGIRTEKIILNFDSIDQFSSILNYADRISNNYFEISFPKLPDLLHEIATELETKGKSFSEVSLKNIDIKGSEATADLHIASSKVRTIDKVIVKGYEDFPVNYIKYVMNLKTGSIFNTKKLDRASTNTKSIPFVQETKSPQTLFTKDSTFIYLYLKKRKSNTFDGLIGFSSRSDGNGLEFNGYLDVVIQNVFNNGEAISLLWKSNGNKNQQFDLGVQFPYIFKTPLTPEASLNIYRQDSIYNNVNLMAGLNYQLWNTGKIGTGVISENSTDLRDFNYNDNIQSYSKLNFGLHFNYLKPFYDPLFSQRFNIDLSTYFGTRRSDNIQTKQISLSLNTMYLWKFNKQNFLFIQNKTNFLSSDNYYQNELYRIGGVNSIRGFNEESIFASGYSIFNMEYRYKLTGTSYINTISDFAYIENDTNKTRDWNYGLGLGYSFLTKVGRLNLSYALGKYEKESFDLNNSKIHINMISFF